MQEQSKQRKNFIFLAITHGTDQSLTDKEITLNSYVKCVRLDILYWNRYTRVASGEVAERLYILKN